MRLQNSRLSVGRAFNFLQSCKLGQIYRSEPRGGWSSASAIIAPNARYIVEPVFNREELIVADLNLSEIDHEFLGLDVSGHYSRSDVFTFETKAQ